jgi:hypothetical protein
LKKNFFLVREENFLGVSAKEGRPKRKINNRGIFKKILPLCIFDKVYNLIKNKVFCQVLISLKDSLRY